MPSVDFGLHMGISEKDGAFSGFGELKNAKRLNNKALKDTISLTIEFSFNEKRHEFH
jgi:hypothetical protein